MPCFYPEGEPGDWCARHAREATVHEAPLKSAPANA